MDNVALMERAVSHLKACGHTRIAHLAGLRSNYNAVARRALWQQQMQQMVQAEQNALKTDDLEEYHLGSLLSGGSSDPKTGNRVGDWADLYDDLQKQALKTRLGIPLLLWHRRSSRPQ